MYECNPSAWVMKTGRSGIQGQLQLHRECQDSLGYMKCRFQEKQTKNVVFYLEKFCLRKKREKGCDAYFKR